MRNAAFELAISPGRRRRNVDAALIGFLLCLLAVSTSQAANTSIRLSEPVAVTDDAEVFGAPLDDTLPVVDLEALAQQQDPDAVGEFLLTTRVARVCQKKGCFFIAQQGATTMRVSFKDYSFFVPTDISGKRVTLSGRLVRRELTTEDAAHYARDLGSESDSAVRPGPAYEIVATSVSVPR